MKHVATITVLKWTTELSQIAETITIDGTPDDNRRIEELCNNVQYFRAVCEFHLELPEYTSQVPSGTFKPRKRKKLPKRKRQPST